MAFVEISRTLVVDAAATARQDDVRERVDDVVRALVADLGGDVSAGLSGEVSARVDEPTSSRVRDLRWPSMPTNWVVPSSSLRKIRRLTAAILAGEPSEEDILLGELL